MIPCRPSARVPLRLHYSTAARRTPPKAKEVTLGRSFEKGDSLSIIKTVLRNSDKLQNLRLYWPHLTKHETSELAQGLFENRSIRSLNLNVNAIDERQMGILTAALRERPVKLHTLRLDYNKVSTEAARMLAQYLQTAYVLEKLTLKKNPLGDEGIQELSKGLVFCNALRELDVSQCEMTSAGGHILLKSLEQMRGDRMLVDVSGNKMGLTAVRAFRAWGKSRGHQVLADSNYPEI